MAATLQRHDEMFTTHGLTQLRDVPGLRLIGPTSAENRAPVFTFTLGGVAAAAVAAHLDEHGRSVHRVRKRVLTRTSHVLTLAGDVSVGREVRLMS